MARYLQGKRGWALLGVGLVMLGAVLVSVFASGEETSFTATPYANVVRFAAKAPVVTLQVQIHDLSGGKVWDSGVAAGFTVDWDRANEWGERLAYGVYLYQAQGWDAQGELVFERIGKLALLPGDRVQLQAAPAIEPSHAPDEGHRVDPKQNFIGYEVKASWLTVQGSGDATRPGGWGTMHMTNTSGLNAYYASIGGDTHCTWEFHPGNDVNNAWSFGALPANQGMDLQITRRVGGVWGSPALLVDFNTGNVGIGTTTPTVVLDVYGTQYIGTTSDGIVNIGNSSTYHVTLDNNEIHARNGSGVSTLFINDFGGDVIIAQLGNVGIGTYGPLARLHVKKSVAGGSSTLSNNVVAFENTSSSYDADVLALKIHSLDPGVSNHYITFLDTGPGCVGRIDGDGAGGVTYGSGACDFAEMLPAVGGLEPGDVLTLGSDGNLVRSTEPYQTSVVGVYSTAPAFLGGIGDEQESVEKVPLAVVGVVPVKASTENGAIQPGDTLTTSNTPGHAMRADPISVNGVTFYPSGVIIGKALEGLDADTGVIQILVMLQ